ncbi:eotaxin-like [Dunckerocampus dactyliophorus]|uniref:eotaxin-like n=1 Tax=Dunckerocampus dactyliophorus TaxID=161453 RepID=UPI0024057C25|nr:eotaxin-like [Dunckerocampus dactyliophorus]
MRLNLILLCLTAWVTSVLSTQRPGVNCCPGLSNTKVRLQNIVNYTIQSVGVCPIKAVLFYTRSGKRICADPDRCWTQEAMLKVDGGVSLQRRQHNNNLAGGCVTAPPRVKSKKAQRRRVRKLRRLKVQEMLARRRKRQ